MKKTLRAFFLISICLITEFSHLSAQCPSSVGILGSPVMINGSCYINIQLAIPNSTVSVYNSFGLVMQGTANSSGNVAISYPCSANPITSITSVITNPALQTCNDFTITPLQILPAKLRSFTVSVNEQRKAVINWATVFEAPNEKIELEKSTDGISFISISAIDCKESSIAERKYTYEDMSFFADPAAYYRIKLTEADGKISYSKTVYVSNSHSTSVTLYPNPLRSGNKFSLLGLKPAEINSKNISISDLTGRNIPFSISAANSIELPAAVTAGIYIVRINDKILKLIKE